MKGNNTGYRRRGSDGNQDLFVAVLLDRSGSMQSIRDDAMGAFNAFINELRADDGRTLVTLTQFDGQSIDMLYEAREVAAVPALTRETFIPRGNTPLYDAAGGMLAATEQRVRALKWMGNTLCVFITDGQENASMEWTRERVFDRVKKLEDDGWAFLYLGAHADAYVQAAAMGVAEGNRAQWQHSSAGAREMGAQLYRSAKGLRDNVRGNKALIWEEERRKLERPES